MTKNIYILLLVFISGLLFFSAALAREDVKTSIRGDNVTVEALSYAAVTVLHNSGIVEGNRQLVITTDAINNAAVTVGAQQPVLRAGDLLVLDTGIAGRIENLSGKIETTNANSSLEINTGTLVNATISQQESYNVRTGRRNRNHYQGTSTYIGEQATIASAGGLEINTTGDVIISGGKVSAADDATLNVGGDMIVIAVQDYSHERSETHSRTNFTREHTIQETATLENLISEILAGGTLTLNIDGALISQGTHFESGVDMHINADLIQLLNAVDFDYEYFFKHRSTLDLKALGGYIGGMLAVSAITGGGGLLGAAAAGGAVLAQDKFRKGTIDILETYNETARKNQFIAGGTIDIGANNGIFIEEFIDGSFVYNPDRVTYGGGWDDFGRAFALGAVTKTVMTGIAWAGDFASFGLENMKATDGGFSEFIAGGKKAGFGQEGFKLKQLSFIGDSAPNFIGKQKILTGETLVGRVVWSGGWVSNYVFEFNPAIPGFLQPDKPTLYPAPQWSVDSMNLDLGIDLEALGLQRDWQLIPVTGLLETDTNLPPALNESHSSLTIDINDRMLL